MDKQKTEKEIEYWSKHQELDKFNYNISTSNYFASISILTSLFLGGLAIGIALKNMNIIIWISVICFFGHIISLIIYLRSTSRSNKHFITRELMIRYWYKNCFKVNTNELDSKNKKIMKLVSCFGRNVPKNLIDAIMEDNKKII